jgi:hypothetical protein
LELNFFLLILGVGMVFWGKKLFWLFISAAGFLFGLSTSQSLMPNEAIWFYLIVAAICGGIAVVLVKLLKNVAFGVGGFVLGAYLADGVLQMMDLNLGTASWVVIILAGAAGAALMLLLFNWALIILSASVGSLLITRAIPGEAPGLQILFIGLIVLGFIAQTRKSSPNRPIPLPPEILP